MVEKARRERVDSDGRGNPTQQWEVFCRDDSDDPMRHVGSVAAESATAAHEHASRLFGWFAVDMWVCPAESVERFSTRGLESETDDREDGSGDRAEGTDTRADKATDRENGSDDEDGEEPRIHPETANASEVNTL